MKLLNFKEFSVNEVFTAKDSKRINDLISKSADDSAKEVQLASNMAKAIKDKTKALQRYQAAEQILGAAHPVSIIFATRANELGHNITIQPSIPTTFADAFQDGEILPIFEYDEQLAEEVWKKYLEIVKKLKGRNWGDSFERKLKREFNDNELVHLAIKRTEYDSEPNRTRTHEYPKLSYATVPKRPWFINPILKKFDFGNAKNDPENPAYPLFTQHRTADTSNQNLEELRVAAQDAYNDYTAPESLFEAGEQYPEHGKSDREIHFNDPWALYFWTHNMLGQMSDGQWENSRKYADQWRWWNTLKPIYDPNAPKDAEGSNAELMNPKIVQRWAVQSSGEYDSIGKIANMNSKDLLPLIRYGDSYSIKSVGSIEKAEEISNNKRVELDLFLAFLAAPTMTKGEVNKIVSNAHSSMLDAMKSSF